jgi:hypothetical protein
MNRGSKELVGIVMFWRDKPTGPSRTLYAALSATALFSLIVLSPRGRSHPKRLFTSTNRRGVFALTCGCLVRDWGQREAASADALLGQGPESGGHICGGDL